MVDTGSVPRFLLTTGSLFLYSSPHSSPLLVPMSVSDLSFVSITQRSRVLETFSVFIYKSNRWWNRRLSSAIKYLSLNPNSSFISGVIEEKVRLESKNIIRIPRRNERKNLNFFRSKLYMEPYSTSEYEIVIKNNRDFKNIIQLKENSQTK
ncbi:hypothetical protein BpHYR1_050069 [Brachionus plicatilis]|uniref:Uncharacterized protein n=1 Tax=Brachionus plicatilis TaxID=10195 RepID=A0A3M7PNV1_BRAPC|nr:hypothetical protein BpHYR1_050069 [Brachionus plicatilis]